MRTSRLGATGLAVSAVGLGTLTWGRDTDEHDAAEHLEAFLDVGGTVIDTAASYADGAAEEILGAQLAERRVRDDVVVVSKAGTRVRGGTGVVDASRAALLTELDASLVRLGTDRVDLWLVQRPDPETTLEETLGALDHAMRTGRARYVGLANHPAWSTAHAATLSRTLLPAPHLAAVEVEHSLLQRGTERELLPAARALGLGVIAWSALGRGVLAGRYRSSVPPASRAASAHLRGFVEPYLDARSASIAEAVATAADGLDVSPAEVALAWSVRSGVDVSLVGASSAAQLRQTLKGAELDLPESIERALDEVSAIPLGYPERL
ncbi:aldo/keto reductase [Georgenia sp. Z1491]|uniref:aldo/keto reductase n=1 Tax=Georgenia sp. Z1491 TaxID=3416707 RepID=UPI003CE84F01